MYQSRATRALQLKCSKQIFVTYFQQGAELRTIIACTGGPIQIGKMQESGIGRRILHCSLHCTLQRKMGRGACLCPPPPFSSYSINVHLYTVSRGFFIDYSCSCKHTQKRTSGTRDGQLAKCRGTIQHKTNTDGPYMITFTVNIIYSHQEKKLQQFAYFISVLQYGRTRKILE